MMQYDPPDVSAKDSETQQRGDGQPTFGDGDIQDLLSEAGRTWQVLERDLQLHWKRHSA